MPETGTSQCQVKRKGAGPEDQALLDNQDPTRTHITAEARNVDATEIQVEELNNMDAEKNEEKKIQQIEEDKAEKTRAEGKKAQEEEEKGKAIEAQDIQTKLQAKVRF